MATDRMARLLLLATSVLLATTLALVAYVLVDRARGVDLERLSPAQRLALIDRAARVSPPVFRQFPFSGDPGFYQMRPGTRYENVYGATFTTDALGFRAGDPATPGDGVRRLVLVGDSWTFSPFVAEDETFPRQLERMLNRDGVRFRVYPLAQMGWTTENQIAALRELSPLLRPDAVVVCPTPNDADESFTVWDGRLVTRGFTSRAVFRDSYMTERRWIDTMRRLQTQTDESRRRGVPFLLYFVGNWRGMPAYYASRAGLTAPAVVLPGAFVEDRYRLSPRIDPGEHPTAEGNGLIAAYLHNALIEAGWVEGLEPLPLDRPVRPLPAEADPERVAEEFRRAREVAYPAHGSDMIPVDPEFMLRHAIYGVPTGGATRRVRVGLRPIDDDALYPLTVTVRLAAPEPVSVTRVLEAFPAEAPEVVLDLPPSLAAYDFVEVVLDADRAAVLPGRAIPVSMRRPAITVE